MINFESIYVDYCHKNGELPDHIEIYQNLDLVWNWIDTHEEKSSLLASLSNTKIVIAVPASMSKAPKFFYDILSDKNEPLYLFDPLTDQFRLEIINKLSTNIKENILKIFGNKQQYVLWKLKRLEKRQNIGSWPKYSESYK